jgi:hypothetical protein
MESSRDATAHDSHPRVSRMATTVVTSFGRADAGGGGGAITPGPRRQPARLSARLDRPIYQNLIVRTRTNCCPAVVANLPDDSGRQVPFGLMVLTLAGGSIMTSRGSRPRAVRGLRSARVSLKGWSITDVLLLPPTRR